MSKTPSLKRQVNFSLTDEEYEQVKGYAQGERAVSAIARRWVLERLIIEKDCTKTAESSDAASEEETSSVD